ncbi:hypothetical protein Q5752_001626 [Cryptotrichosporon argae]
MATPASERTRLLGDPSGSTHHNLLGLPAWRFRLLLAALWSATFLGAFDSTVIATLLSPISSSFSAFHLASWLGTAYLLSVSCFTPVYGRLSDGLGRRNAQTVAMAFFILGTLGCAAAPGMGWLIAARALAGVGGGGIMSVGSIIVSDLVDLSRRGLYQGYANLLFGLGAALGGPVGGWIAETVGWRIAFGAQVPLLVASAVAIAVLVPRETRPDAGPAADADADGSGSGTAPVSLAARLRRLDYAGTLSLVGAIGALLLAVSIRTAATHPSGRDYRFADTPVLGLLLASAALSALFVLVEAKFAPEPVLPLSLLTHRTPLAVALSNFFMATSIFSVLYNVPLYFTAVRVTSSSAAGAHLLPNSILVGVGSLTVGLVMRKTRSYYAPMIASAAVIVASTAAMLTWNETSPAWLTWVAQAPSGFGYAGVLTSTLVALMAHVTKAGRGEIAVATSMTYTFRTTGQVLGVALSSALLQSVVASNLALARPNGVSIPPAVVRTIRRDTSAIRALDPAFRDAAVGAYAHGLHVVAWANFALALATLAVLCVAKNEGMPEQAPKVGDEEA